MTTLTKRIPYAAGFLGLICLYLGAPTALDIAMFMLVLVSIVAAEIITAVQDLFGSVPAQQYE